MSARTVLLLSLFLAAPALVRFADAQSATPPSAPAPASATASTNPADQATPAAPQEPEDANNALLHVDRVDGVAATVNDSPISNYDVRQRVALFVSTSGTRPTADALKQIRDQVLKQLETERIELLEAEKNKVSVSAAEVDKAIADIMKDNHLSPEQLNKILSSGGVRMETLRAQIAAQIAWSKLVQDQLGDRVHVSALDVDDELGRLRQGANQPHYHIAEIFQAVDTPEQDSKVKKDMDNLETELHAGAPFSAVARQFSQNPTAAQGGDMGVVQEGQIPPELDKVMKAMRPGDISPPIRATGGYYILFLRDLEEPEGANIPDPTPQPSGPPGTLPLVRILLPIGPKPSSELLQNAMKAAAVMRSQIQSCPIAEELSKRLTGSRFFNLGNQRLSDLSPEMQSAITQAEPGGAAPPMQSAAGIEIIVRCDKPVPKIGRFRLPNRDEVENEIYEEQITTLARQYLRDLKRDADVETVGKS